MKEYSIKIPDINAAKEFCRLAGACDFDVDLAFNRIVIDAKSILGVLSMDLQRELRVTAYGENAAFDAYCERLQALAKSVA